MHHRSDTSIAETKSDILGGVRPGGTAVLPRDSQYFEYLLKRAEAQQDIERILTFGQHGDADVRLLDQRLDTECTQVKIDCCGERLHYRVGLPGEHHALNSLAVMAVVTALGADKSLAASALSSLPPSFRRCERFRIERPDGVCELIDDSWNASPESIAAAILLLNRRPVPADGRRVLILGDMLELGSDERTLHRSLTALINKANVDVVYTAGVLTEEIQNALPKSHQGGHFGSYRELAAQLNGLIQAGDCVLVKGSNAMEMIRVVNSALRGKARNACSASRYWNLAVEVEGCSTRNAQQTAPPLTRLACADTKSASLPIDMRSRSFLNVLRDCLSDACATSFNELDASRFTDEVPGCMWGFAITLYQPGVERLLVVRAESKNPLDNVRRTMERVRLHPRFGEFDLSDWSRGRMQVDFIVDAPELVDLATLSDTVLPDGVGDLHRVDAITSLESHHAASDGYAEAVGVAWQVQVADWTDAISAKRTMTRFELGVDGLRIVKRR